MTLLHLGLHFGYKSETLMLERFKQHIADHQLFQTSERILLAVSGGIDSVCMVHLFREANYDFGIAHCNFQLRGEASDLDALFVKNLAGQYKIPFFDISFDTTKISQQHKKGIQETARDLRYEWLENIRTEKDFDYIATAHHLNDSIETALFNLGRGGGIRAARGILEKHDNIIRPLLFAHKKNIVSYVQDVDLVWRNDASNVEDKYARNHIRHHVVPALKVVLPQLEKNMSISLAHLKEVEKLYDWSVEQIRQIVFTQTEEGYRIDIQQLRTYPAASTVLYELLKTFGFTSSDAAQMLESRVGSLFESATHHALLDRHILLIELIDSKSKTNYSIPEDTTTFSFENHHFQIDLLEAKDVTFDRNTAIAYLDYDKLKFPLTLRHWQTGDFFHPLGMNGQRKKLQDFFSDQKIDRWTKDNIWLLQSGSDIVWIVDYRISESYKIDKHTKMVYCLTFIKQ